MSEVSSYLSYLPPVLWRDDPVPGEEAGSRLGLGAMLRVFEKVATGIPDGVPTARPALTGQIADLHRLFDPWTTPAEFLPWLASWVALEFPSLQGVPLWDEYQRRKVTAEIARIYRLRGRRAGLNQYLELYAVGQARPRVTVDDGARLLSVIPRPGERSEVSALVSQGPVVIGDHVRSEGLTRPWAVATAGDGSLLVGDIGLPTSAPVVPSRIWHLDRSGRYELSGTPPRPAPLAPSTANLNQIVGVAVRPPRGGAPETAYVLTRTGRIFSIPAPYRGQPATQLTQLTNANAPIWTIAITVDPASGDLLVLDRGGKSPQQLAKPSVVTVRPNPLQVTRTAVTAVVEPLSIAVEADGTLLIGDGGPQDEEVSAPADLCGNIWRANRSATPWTLTKLLPAVNPLTAPTALARARDGQLYALDAGLKPISPSSTDPFICPVAEHAAVYAVDLTATPPTVVRTTGPGQFVYPTGMVAAGDHLVVADPGQPEVEGLEPFWGRVRPFQFDVSIHFTRSRLPEDPDELRRVLDQAVGNISSIVDEQKPAHTLWTLATSIL